MNILLLNQYYPPDVAPTGVALHDVAVSLVDRGHTVTVLCSTGSYDGGARHPAYAMCDGVHVRRVHAFGFGRRRFLGKLLDYASFLAALSVGVLRLRPAPDLILSLTTPPYVGLVGCLAARRFGCPHAHWMMDLYPDAMVAHRLLRPGGRRERALAGLTRVMLRGCRLVLTLAPDMAERVSRYLAPPATARWVPLWGAPPSPRDAVAAQARRRRSECGWSDETLVLMYSGNMGLGHCFGEFLDAAAITAEDPHVQWVFAGGGKRRGEIESFVARNPQSRIALLPYVPHGDLAAHLLSADVQLASLDPDWQGCMLPSKLQGAFAAGVPVILVAPETSSLAHWVREAGGGWVVPPGDTTSLLRAVDAARDANARRTCGERARTYAAEHFDRARNTQRIAELIEEAGA